MAQNGMLLRFDKVSFGYGPQKPILDEVVFSVRRGAKLTLMGQNGSGKSTLFHLITGEEKPEGGQINMEQKPAVALARQVIARDQMKLTVREFFAECFKEKKYDLDLRIEEILKVVNLHAPLDKAVKSFSGGQQARLLLASALIQDPDLLLLDEPTNNLDKEGIAHLTRFLIDYKKTCIVISHDADFLNSFTGGVLYLDVFTHKIEQYVGDYFDAVSQIAVRIEKEEMKNAQLAKEIQENKDKANFFANKGGRMRLLAKRMRDKAEELEEEKVDVRREDKTIRPFVIPSQPNLSGEIVKISSYTAFKNHKLVTRPCAVSMRKKEHLLLAGPNGIGKSTFLESLARGTAKGIEIAPGTSIGYYRQDFSTLNFEHTVYESLSSVMKGDNDHDLRSPAAGFLINSELMKSKVGSLSEGQKGLVAFAQLVLQEPGLLILDEPTNHINFRHLPMIAQALDKYEGVMILVSHVPDFVKQIKIDEILDLGK
ncbi:MAG: ABC-F family ATP-binding cassette domain-containing protein [Candidatus Portnoybacteria bacterium]|nr:ABC-F family ATP-binding cassette domain-containing protein [Candidatus Portnoybacteria bacterium]MDD4982535.1 ABC-F family ATP-binding cassette domain-containing protein [Candidatus Portnoybacteria bacterium]